MLGFGYIVVAVLFSSTELNETGVVCVQDETITKGTATLIKLQSIALVRTIIISTLKLYICLSRIHRTLFNAFQTLFTCRVVCSV